MAGPVRAGSDELVGVVSWVGLLVQLGCLVGLDELDWLSLVC